MSNTITRLLAAGKREVTLPESGLEVRIVRARVYAFMKQRVAVGSLMQAMGGAMWHIARGKDIPDKVAAQINASSPSFADLMEKLVMECVLEMRLPDEEWKRVCVVEDDVGTDESKDQIAVSDFTRGLALVDVRTLERAIMDHNGLSKGVEQMLAGFRPEGRATDSQDGEELQDAPDGDPGDGPPGVQSERSDHDGGGERGGGGAEEGGDVSTAEAGE